MCIIILWLKIIDEAEQVFLKAAKLGENPSYESREPDLPVGLKVNLMPFFSHTKAHLRKTKNLGATCYANASLQVS